MNKINLVNTLFLKVKQSEFNDSDFFKLCKEFTDKEIQVEIIKKYSESDSKNLIDTLIKSTSLKIFNIISFDDKYKFSEQIIIEIFNCLFLNYDFSSSDCFLEYSRLKNDINKNVLNILKRISCKGSICVEDNNSIGCINDKIEYYLQNKEGIEIIGINLSLISKKVKNIKNKKLRILNDKKMNDEFLLCICDLKKEIVNENLRNIFIECKNELKNCKGIIKSNKLLFKMAIISEINPIIKEKDIGLFDIVAEEVSEAYLGYVFSLMVDNESKIKAWQVLMEQGFVNDIFDSLKELYSLLHLNQSVGKKDNAYNNAQDTAQSNAMIYSDASTEERGRECLSVLKYGLKILISVVSSFSESHIFFIRNFDLVLNLLWTELPYNVLGDLFTFVSFLMYDDEIKNRVYDYFTLTKALNAKTYKNDVQGYFLYNKRNIFDAFQDELKKESFELTEGIVNFFSKTNIFEDERNEFFNCAIKSCNLKILNVILENLNIKKLYAKENVLKAIKKGIEKNEKICDLFIKFIMKNDTKGVDMHKTDTHGDKGVNMHGPATYGAKGVDMHGALSMHEIGAEMHGTDSDSAHNTVNNTTAHVAELLYLVSQDVGLLNLIIKSKSNLFFEFAALLNPNSLVLFLNEDFLERISENIDAGLKYLGDVCYKNHEFCKFVVNNKSFFNNIEDWESKLRMLDAVANHFIQEFGINDNVLIVKKCNSKYFYRIITKLIIYKHCIGENVKKYIVKDYFYTPENLESYCEYLKTLLALEENIDEEIKYLLGMELENECIADLIGYYKSVSDKCSFNYNFECKTLKNKILNSLNTKDNDLFVKYFSKANKYEKFLLFFILDYDKLNQKYYNRKIYECVFEELKEITKYKIQDKQNELVLQQCLNTMLYMQNLDEVIKLLKSIKLPAMYNDLLIKLSIKNMINNGKEIFDIAILSSGNVDLQAKCCFFAWAYKIIKIKTIKKWVEDLRKKIVCDDLEYVRKELQKQD